MTVTEFFAGVPVADYHAALVWYLRLFGRPPDLFPNDNEAVWQVGEHAFVYVVGDPARVGNGLLTLLVDDLDQQVAELTERGIAVEAIVELPGLVRKAEVTDPDGNRITYAQPVGASG